MSLLADYHGPRTRSRALEHPSDERLSGNGRRGRPGAVSWPSARAGDRRSGCWAWPGLFMRSFWSSGWSSPARIKRSVKRTGQVHSMNRMRGPPTGGIRLAGHTDAADPHEPGGCLASVRFCRVRISWRRLSDLAADVTSSRASIWGSTTRRSRRHCGRWPVLPGAILGGVAADRAARRRKGGRIRVQSLGLSLAAPFVFLTGWSTSVPVLIAGLDRRRALQGNL